MSMSAAMAGISWFVITVNCGCGCPGLIQINRFRSSSRLMTTWTRALNATLRFWRRINKPGSPLHEPFPLTKQQRDRLILMLRALDGHLDEASYREIAEVLFGARRMESEPWKTSSLRDRTIRLVRGGIALMESGYRKLLRGR